MLKTTETVDNVYTSPLDNVYTSPSGDAEFTYKALSRAAILATTFGVMGLMAWVAPLLSFLPLLAVIFAFAAFGNLKKYSEELTGKVWAWVGLVLGSTLLVAAPVKHTYVYFTEVPDGYERVSFGDLKSPTGGQDIPTQAAFEMNGKKIFLKGYIHPTSVSGMNAKTFVLVPDWATCCFGTQPPKTHMIEVRLTNDKFAQKSFRQHSLAGTFYVDIHPRQVDGLDGVYYFLEAEHFERSR
jgi:hypothetical protein